MILICRIHFLIYFLLNFTIIFRFPAFLELLIVFHIHLRIIFTLSFFNFILLFSLCIHYTLLLNISISQIFSPFFLNFWEDVALFIPKFSLPNPISPCLNNTFFVITKLFTGFRSFLHSVRNCLFFSIHLFLYLANLSIFVSLLLSDNFSVSINASVYELYAFIPFRLSTDSAKFISITFHTYSAIYHAFSRKILNRFTVCLLSNTSI